MTRGEKFLAGMLVIATIVAIPSAWRWLKRTMTAMLILGALLLAACAPMSIKTDASAPNLLLRAFPPVGIAPQNVLLTAEIIGEPAERFYCPKVKWIFPDETGAVEESDCPPYDQREDYQRRWTKGVRVGSGEWLFAVELEKSGKTVARAEAKVLVARDVGNMIARIVPVSR